MEVSLLMADLKEAQELGRCFRSLGIVPAVYEDLDLFWKDCLKRTPELALVDVRLMVAGEKRLIDHPKVRSDELSLAFYYDQAFLPLVPSTREFAHLGLIQKAPGADYYSPQLHPILMRANQRLAWAKRLQQARQEAQEWESKAVGQIQASQEARREARTLELLKGWVQELESSCQRMSMTEALGALLEARPEFTSYMLLEVAPNGQRLISAALDGPKHHKVPSLWPGSSCEKGMDAYARNLIIQVGIEVLGDAAVPLFLNGGGDNPSLALVVAISDGGIPMDMDWTLFESAVGGILARQLLRQRPSASAAKSETTGLISPWELMARLDSAFFQGEGKDKEPQLFDLDLSELVAMIRSLAGQRFYWRELIRDFSDKLLRQLPEGTVACAYGVERIAVLLPHASPAGNSAILKLLKEFTARYPFYRFFESPDTALVREVPVRVRCVPASTEAYQRLARGLESYVTTPSTSTPTQGPTSGTKLQGRPEARP